MEFLTIKDELDYCTSRYYLRKEIENIFVNEGYSQIEPSTFEEYDNFRSFNSKITNKTLVKVIGGNGEVLILRPDITMNIIRSLIPRWEKGARLKLFYNTTVYRNRIDSNIKELKQMGIEYLGENSLLADKDVILVALEVLKKYNADFILELGSSKYLEGLLKEIKSSEIVDEIKNLIYRKNKSELSKYLESVDTNKNIVDVLLNIIDFQGNIDTVTKLTKAYYLNDEMKNSLDELGELVKSIEGTSFYNNIHLDLSMITELDYYDGIIFKGYYPNSHQEIISGGRYDSLTSLFGTKVPAIGFSIDLDQLLKVVNLGGESKWTI